MLVILMDMITFIPTLDDHILKKNTMKTLLILFVLPLAFSNLNNQFVKSKAMSMVVAPDYSLQLPWGLVQTTAGALSNKGFKGSPGPQNATIELNPTATAELLERFQVRIFPSPTSEWLQLEREKDAVSTEWIVSVFAVQGKILKGSKLTWAAGQPQLALPVAGLSAGTYFVVLRNRTRPATASVPFVKF